MDTASALAQKVLSIDGVKRLIEEHNTHQVLQVVQIIQKEKDNYKDYMYPTYIAPYVDSRAVSRYPMVTASTLLTLFKKQHLK